MRAVYQIRNSISDKLYVGSSIDLRERFNNHRSALRRGKHGNKHLQGAWNTYGESAFVFEVIEECDELSDAELLTREQLYFAITGCTDPNRGYNLCVVASGSPGRYMPQSVESRAKRSAALTGRKFTSVHRARLSAALQGRKLSPEHAKKAATVNLGRKFSPEHRARQAAAATGRILAATACAKIAKANAKRKIKPETRQKLSVAAKARATTRQRDAKGHLIASKESK